jgi:hypothetical protein
MTNSTLLAVPSSSTSVTSAPTSAATGSTLSRNDKIAIGVAVPVGVIGIIVVIVGMVYQWIPVPLPKALQRRRTQKDSPDSPLQVDSIAELPNKEKEAASSRVQMNSLAELSGRQKEATQSWAETNNLAELPSRPAELPSNPSELPTHR